VVHPDLSTVQPVLSLMHPSMLPVTALGNTKILWEYGKGGEGIVLREGGDIRRRGESGEMVAG